ncbi:TetR/AcrR family transcriptional regulator [Conexibacter sp. DBS9H8]|uniref:TetR/AcrR family transcriptional regulator n=1 Tax=Conexibacter sp. DBS9H8 TaxID=2937801 RepID=UPI00200C8168|nr:TetR/AcrR family transcriptional regulator [Conexibacter sp. DBS9H8]
MSDVKPPTERRAYAGRTGEDRAAGRREALIDAAFTLVAADGWRALRIDAVCRAAGLNKRYFYESFADLDALVGALTASLADAAIAVTLAAIPTGATPEEAATRGIAAFVHHLTDDPRRARVLFGVVPASDRAAGHRSAAIHRLVSTAARTGRDLHVLGAAASVDIAAAMLVGGTSQVILDWLDGTLPCSEGTLIASLIAFWQVVGDSAAAQAHPGHA